MIAYNNIIYGLAEHVNFKRFSSRKKRIKYIIYADKNAYLINGVAAKLFQYILKTEKFNYKDISKEIGGFNILFNKAITKHLLFFRDMEWIEGKNEQENRNWGLTSDTYCSKVDEKYYITNLLYKTMDSLTRETYDRLINNEFNKLTYDELFYLYTRKYLNDASKSERADFEIQNKDTNVYLIFSYDCNLRCVYCFERDKSKKLEMTSEVLNKTIEYINSLSNNNGVVITFYGGEPLLEKNRENINTIINQFKHNSRVYFRFITNGVYIKEYMDTFKQVKNKITNFTITLDGTKKVHDNRRLSKESYGSFDSIIKSIGILNQLNYPVIIRINLNHENIDCQEELIHYLNKTIKNKKYIKIEYHRVEDKANVNYEPISLVDCYKVYNHIEKISNFNVNFKLPIINILSGIDKYPNNVPQVRKTHCTIDSNVVIDYDGQVYSCNEAMGIENFKIGDVSNEHNMCSRNYEANSNCKSCNLYLGCYGGCYLSNHYFNEETGQNKCDYSQIKDVITYYQRNN